MSISLQIKGPNFNGQMQIQHQEYAETIEIILDSDNLYKNVSTLFLRMKGQHFIVKGEGENAELHQIRGLSDRIKYFFNKSVEQKKVQYLISKTIRKLNTQIVIDEGLKGIYQVALQKIFFGDMARMSHAVYDRSCIEYSTTSGNTLISLLSPEFIEAEDKLQASMNVAAQVANKQELITAENQVIDDLLNVYRIAQRFSFNIGKDLKKLNGGSGSAYISAHHFDGKKIPSPENADKQIDGEMLVVKPFDEGPYGKNNPNPISTPIKQMFSMKKCLMGNMEYTAEHDCSILDRLFDIRVVPPTIISRNVNSKFFINASVKECSLQTFVKDSKPLGEYIGLPEWMHALPNRFIEWYLRTVLKPQLPTEELQFVAALIGLTEDTDSHFRNVLIKHKDTTDPNNVAARIFNEARFTDENPAAMPTSQEIKDFVDHLFENNNNQKLLQEFFRSAKNGVMFIKHDGGATHPHTHPTDYYETRFKYLMTLLLPDQQRFADTIKEHFKNPQEKFVKYIRQKALNDLQAVVPQIEKFHNYEGIKLLLDTWALVEKNSESHRTMTQQIQELILANLNFDGASADDRMHQEQSCAQHLGRIKNGLETRRDSWKLFAYFLKHDLPMRDSKNKKGFFDIKTKADYEKWLKNSAVVSDASVTQFNFEKLNSKSEV